MLRTIDIGATILLTIVFAIIAILGFIFEHYILYLPIFMICLTLWLPCLIEEAISHIDRKLQDTSKHKSWGS